MPLSTVNSAGTHKPGVPHKASLAKSGHMQNTKETIAVSPAALPIKQAIEEPGLCSQEKMTTALAADRTSCNH